MEKGIAGEGAYWKQHNDTYFSPEAKNMGPNALFLLRDSSFTYGTIEAVVTPVKKQPQFRSNRLECGLVGRCRNANNYVTGGITIDVDENNKASKSDFFISEVSDGIIRVFRPEPGSVHEAVVSPGTSLRLRLALTQDAVELYCDDRLVLAKRMSVSSNGYTGFRSNWTEVQFHDCKVQNMDKPCLVMGAGGADDSDVRRKSDVLLTELLQPVMVQFGYRAERADRNRDNMGLLNPDIMTRIFNDDIVIANLTDYRPIVFYELALRHATHKPCILMIQSGQPLPFDFKDFSTIAFDLSSPESRERAQAELGKRVEQILEPMNAGNMVTKYIPAEWRLVKEEKHRMETMGPHVHMTEYLSRQPIIQS